jgi:hypothetical protein
MLAMWDRLREASRGGSPRLATRRSARLASSRCPGASNRISARSRGRRQPPPTARRMTSLRRWAPFSGAYCQSWQTGPLNSPLRAFLIITAGLKLASATYARTGNRLLPKPPNCFKGSTSTRWSRATCSIRRAGAMDIPPGTARGTRGAAGRDRHRCHGLSSRLRRFAKRVAHLSRRRRDSPRPANPR